MISEPKVEIPLFKNNLILPTGQLSQKETPTTSDSEMTHLIFDAHPNRPAYKDGNPIRPTAKVIPAWGKRSAAP